MRAAHRNEFLMHAVRAGLPNPVALTVTRHASTHDRLAEAECNGDWPCDNGERKVVFCDRCGSGYVRSKVVKGICESCRIEDRITALVSPFGVKAEFQGDPRGWTVTLVKAVL